MKKLLLLLPMLVLVSCGDKHMTLDRAKVSAGANTQAGAGDAAVTYVRDIKPIFQRACTACHNEGSAIPNWNSYEVSFAKKDRLLDRVVIKRDMPLGMPMTDEERALVAEWLKLGAPQGGAESTPPPTQVAMPEPPSASPAPEAPSEPAPAPAPQPPTSSEGEILTYAKVKTAVFDQYCALCHNENTGDLMPNWGSFSVVSSRKDKIYTRVVLEKTMPPEGMPFSEEARDMLKQWIDEGAVE